MESECYEASSVIAFFVRPTSEYLKHGAQNSSGLLRLWLRDIQTTKLTIRFVFRPLATLNVPSWHETGYSKQPFENGFGVSHVSRPDMQIVRLEC